jgi:hypothetical protein
LPRADRTFKSGDIIRFYGNNLDSVERAEVLAFFLMVAGPVEIEDFLGTIEDILEGIPGGRAVRGFLSVLRRLFRLSATLNSFIISQVFKEQTLREVQAYLEDQ